MSEMSSMMKRLWSRFLNWLDEFGDVPDPSVYNGDEIWLGV